MSRLTDRSARARLARLSRRLINSPVLPILGVTKTVESVVAGGDANAWIAYTIAATLLFVVGDEIENVYEEATE